MYVKKFFLCQDVSFVMPSIVGCGRLTENTVCGRMGKAA